MNALSGLFKVTVLMIVTIAGCGGRGDSSPLPESTSVGRDEVIAGATSNTASTNVPGGDSSNLLEPIRQLISTGKMDEAHEAIQRHLISNPDDPNALVLAAQTSFAMGNVDRAVELLDEAVPYWPDNEKNLKARAAELLAESSRSSEAITRLEELVNQYPQFDGARRRLAGLLNARGFRFDANEHIRQLCRRGGATAEELRGLIAPSRTFATFAEKPDTDDAEAIEKAGALSVALALFGQGDVRDALTVLQRSDLIKERHPCAVALYGQVLIEAQQFDQFQDWLDGAEEACERYPAYWMTLGGWALHHQQHETAVRMYAEAVLREPGDAAANHRLTQALSAAGQHETAARFRQRSAQINQLTQIIGAVFSDPDAGPEAITQLAALLAEAGRPMEALAWHRLLLAGTNAPDEAIKQLAAEQRKVILAEQQNADHLRSVLLCGLKLDDYPIDPAWLAESRRKLSDPDSPPGHDTRKALPPSFVNVAERVGLDFTYLNAPIRVEREFRIFQAYGGGVACLDYDLDGNVDFYLGQAAGEPPEGRGTSPNQLARNLGGSVQNVTEPAGCDDRGYTCGITAGDWNQDGFPDLVIGNMQENSLWINQGDGTFRRHGGDAMWDEPKYTTSLAIADVSGDQLPDIVEINYLDDPSIYDPIQYKPDGKPVVLPGPLHFQPAVDRLFVSLGDGSMRGELLGGKQSSSGAGPGEKAAPPATGLGVLVTNLDDAAGNEVFVANDLMANHLWQRLPGRDDVAWQDFAVVRGVAYGAGGMPLACMGIAAADFDENGRLDLHITNFADQWSNQYMQNESGVFVDLTLPLGLDRDSLKMLGFGTQAIDYDNNSTVDLVVGNGHVEDFSAKGTAFEMPTQVFAWQNGRFESMPVSGDPDYWNSGHLSRALARCDWNNDGRVDFVVTDLKQPVALLENRTQTPYHWLQLELVGTTCERDAIGAIVEVTTACRTVTAFVQTGDGYMCKNQSMLAFGLGDCDTVEQLTIQWPNGDRQTITGLKADQRWLIVQGDVRPFARIP